MDLDIEKLKDLIRNLFIKKECDLSQVHVQGAILAAVGAMSQAVDGEYSREEIINIVGPLFGFGSDAKELSNIMNSSYVSSAIGYSVQFEDLASARVNYESQKELYDNLYKTLIELKDLGLISNQTL